jgi:hypothetical protein
MKIPRGTLALQLSSASLALIAVTLYQKTAATPPTSQAHASQRKLYRHYEEVLMLLYANQPLSAAEQLASLPHEPVSVSPSLLRDDTLTYTAEGLFLELGMMFSRHALRAAYQGELQRAQLLVDACQSLHCRLTHSSTAETPQEATKRQKLLHSLAKVAQSAATRLESVSGQPIEADRVLGEELALVRNGPSGDQGLEGGHPV